MQKFSDSYLLLLVLTIGAFMQPATGADQPATKPKQFIYVLRLVPRLYADASWTPEDKAALDRHFARFQHAIETGELIHL